MPRKKKSPVSFPFNPLGTCPSQLKKRWEKKAKKAHSSYKTAVELKCMECVAWDRKEAVTCFVTSCPLHAFNRVIFNKGQGNSTADTCPSSDPKTTSSRLEPASDVP